MNSSLLLVISTLFFGFATSAAPIEKNKSSSPVSLSAKICSKLGKIKDVTPFSWKASSIKIEPKNWISENFQSSLGSPGDFRWATEKTSGKTYLERKDVGKNFYSSPTEIGSCEAEQDRSLTLFKCPIAAVLLYNGKTLLAVSVEDYAPQKAAILEQLKFNGHDAFLAEFGIKSGSVWYLVPKEVGKFEPKKCREEISGETESE